MQLVEDLLDGARSGQDRIEDLSDAAEAKARRVKRDAAHAVGTAADTTRQAVRKTQRKAKRVVRDVASKTKG
jgi:vacuolar-type H+-ATPase subunit E/Vma4